MNKEQLRDYAQVIMEQQKDLLPIIDEWSYPQSEGVDVFCQFAKIKK